ncbi:MAG: hypothetical protein WCO10_00140 [bacterium]
MNSSTASPLGTDFAQELFLHMQDAISDGTKQACRMVWDVIQQFMMEHWFFLIVGLVILFWIAIIRWISTGRWGMFASLLYHCLYFGTLLVATLIFGPEIFASDYTKLWLFILYLVCFGLVGWFIRATGILGCLYPDGRSKIRRPRF